MGQAKIRGTKDERIAQAQKRDELERSANELAKEAAAYARAQRLAELPPEVRGRAMERERVKNLRLASILGIAAMVMTTGGDDGRG